MSHSDSNDFQSAIVSFLTRGFFFIRLLYVKVIFAAALAQLSSSIFPEKKREKIEMVFCYQKFSSDREILLKFKAENLENF